MPSAPAKAPLLHQLNVVAMVLTMGAVHAAEPIGVELVHGGKRQELSDEARSQIAERLPKLFATCSINSQKYPKIFVSWSFPAVWQETAAKDHVRSEELLIGLQDPKFPGPYLSREGERVTAYTKCSGIDVIRFVCAPGVKAAMPAHYHKLCVHLAEIERSGTR